MSHLSILDKGYSTHIFQGSSGPISSSDPLGRTWSHLLNRVAPFYFHLVKLKLIPFHWYDCSSILGSLADSGSWQVSSSPEKGQDLSLHPKKQKRLTKPMLLYVARGRNMTKQQEDSGVWSILKGKGKREAQSLTDTFPILYLRIQDAGRLPGVLLGNLSVS